MRDRFEDDFDKTFRFMFLAAIVAWVIGMGLTIWFVVWLIGIVNQLVGEL